jgi:hypothetical protein
MPFRNPILGLFVCLTCAAGLYAQSVPAPAVPVQPEALTALNNAFRAAYADAKTRVLAASGPTLIANGDTFILLHDGRRIEANVGTPIYDPVKTIAHIPLAIYVILTPGDGAVGEDRLKALAGLRELIPPAEAGLDSVKLSAATLARQKQIVAASLAFLDEVVERRSVARAKLVAFTRSMTPAVMKNVADATRAQLDATHAQVAILRRELSPQEWSRLHVVIIGPHMPRQDLVVTQYFLRLLHEPAEGRRVVYAESLWEEPKALDLLGTHLLDGSVGEAFFGDYLRMHRDLLGDVAHEYLPHLLPK